MAGWRVWEKFCAVSGSMTVTPGYVYVLSHPLWSRIGQTGAVKIGKTRHDPNKRSLQIASASGLLSRPTVEWCAWVADCGAVERAVHRHLSRYRVSSRRELFAVPVDVARTVIERSTKVRSIRVMPRSTRRRKRYGHADIWGIVILSLLAVILYLRHH